MGVGRRVGAGGTADGALVNIDHLVELIKSEDGVAVGRVFAAAIDLQGGMAIEGVVNQGGFTRTGHASDGRHQANGNVDIYLVMLILAGSTIGAQFGARASKKLRGPRIRLLFGVIIAIVMIALLRDVLTTMGII